MRQLCANIRSRIKLEVHCNADRGESSHGHGWHAQKLAENMTCSSGNMLTHRKTLEQINKRIRLSQYSAHGGGLAVILTNYQNKQEMKVQHITELMQAQ